MTTTSPNHAFLPDLSVEDAALAFAAGADSEFSSQAGAVAGSRLIQGLPADLYHADRDHLSCSLLKPLLISPEHFRVALVQPGCASKVKDFGSLVHTLVLEPHRVGLDYAVFPGHADGRTSDYKKFLEANLSRMVVDEATFQRARVLADKILNRPVFGRPFGDYVREGIAEPSLYFEDSTTGVKLRTRIDLLHPDFTFDLKTTRHSLVRPFIRDAIDLHYDLQAFMYTLSRALFEGGHKAQPFVFIAAESDAPNSVHVVRAGESFMNNGAKKYQEVISVYAACRAIDYWPNASSDETAEIEPWHQFTAVSSWKKLLVS